MENLRSKLIRLAHANPEFRKDILPLVSKTADETVYQVRDLKGELIIWEVPKGSHAQKVKTPKLVEEFPSRGAAKSFILKGREKA